MSNYSYSAPCTCLLLNSQLVEELRAAINGSENDIAKHAAEQPDYLMQMRGLIAKDQPIPFKLIKTYWKNHKGIDNDNNNRNS